MGDENTAWQDSLPEGFKDAPFFKAAESPEKALEAINNAATHMGNSIRLPGEDAGAEDISAFAVKAMEKFPTLMLKPDITSDDAMSAFFRSAGQPEKFEDYTYAAPEGKDVPEDLSAFSKVAHKYGLSQKQFEGVLGEVLGQQWTSDETAEAEQAEEMKGLVTEWGAANDQNMGIVKNFLKLTDAPDGLQALFESGAMSASEIKYFHGIAVQTKAPVELTQQHSDNSVLSPAQAQDKIQEIMNNKEHPYWLSADPRHKAAIQKMLDLHALVDPSASTDANQFRK